MSEFLQEKWLKMVAVTTTVLAILTAITAARGGACGAKIQLFTAVAGSKWSYYQAKSIKENLAETQKRFISVNSLGSTTPEQKSALEAMLKGVDGEIARYDKEKNEIRKDAEVVEIQNNLLYKKASWFSLTIVFFQIAIMMSSVSALLKRKEMWVTGLVIGVIATVFLGFALFLPPVLF